MKLMDIIVIGLLALFPIGLGLAVRFHDPWWLLLSAAMLLVFYAGG